MKLLKRILFMALVATALIAAQTIGYADGVADPASVITTATTDFGLVAALSVTILGFWIAFRVVRKSGKG